MIHPNGFDWKHGFFVGVALALLLALLFRQNDRTEAQVQADAFSEHAKRFADAENAKKNARSTVAMTRLGRAS